MIKAFLKQLFESVFNYKRTREIKVLLKQPRYQAGKSMLFGFPMYYVDGSTFFHGFKEIFSKEPYRFNSTSANPLILDCGANIGLSVLYFKKLYPQAKIIAFEPDPNIFKILEKNVQANNLTDIELVNKAVWINDDGIDFEIEGGFSGRINKYHSEKNIVKVETQRLYDLLNKNVSFLKIDIEGAEFEVIKDCAQKLSLIKYIFIEYHSHVSEEQKLDQILSILSEAGFRYHIKEAHTSEHPFIDNNLMLGMDLQLNIFGINSNVK